MKSSAFLLICFLGGLMIGSVGLLPEFFTNAEPIIHATLLLLLFLIGVGVGSSRDIWQLLRANRLRLVLVPVAVIAGTLGGSALFSLLLPNISLREAMAVGAGFGYYSLSSVVITEIHGQALGVLALLANVQRELLTLLLTPLLARCCGQLAPIASAGATAMDTTLPLISRIVGPEYTVIAIFSGVILTVLVPILVTLLLS